MQFLLQFLENTGRYLAAQTWLVLNPNQPLSWKTLLSLCIFSWLMAFITSDAQWIGILAGNLEKTNTPASFLGFPMSFARWLLFTLGWIFLCLSMAWMLAKSRVTLPFFGLKIYPAAWVVGLLSSTYVFLLGTGEVRMGAIVAWPCLSALYTLLPKLITSKGKFQPPTPVVRQHFVMILFASATVSCWLQFCILMQGWLAEYPPLTLGPLAQSTFVTPVGTDSAVVQMVQETLDQTVQLLPEDQLRRWLRNLKNPENRDSVSEAVNARFQAKLLPAQASPAPDDSTAEEDGAGEENEVTVPTPPTPVSETWRLTLAWNEVDAQAVRVQVRSLLPTPSTASDAYIEYHCPIQKSPPANSPPPGDENPENYRQHTINNCNFTEFYIP